MNNLVINIHEFRFLPLDYQKQKESLNQLLSTKQRIIKRKNYVAIFLIVLN